jgi:hypothetical protein
MGCMTAPAKAPSSRTFARQRQQLSQQLYDQWTAQVSAAAHVDDARWQALQFVMAVVQLIPAKRCNFLHLTTPP